MTIIYPLVSAVLFGLLYGESAWSHTNSPLTGAFVLLVVGVAMYLSFVIPPRLFVMTDEDKAPAVMSALVNRWAVAAGFILAADVTAIVLARGLTRLYFIEELYGYTLIAALLFQGFGGVFASHVTYLQRTRQYNPNQLVVILVAATVLLLLLTLYFLAFDIALPRDDHIHRRNLILLTTILVGYGHAVYMVAHH